MAFKRCLLVLVIMVLSFLFTSTAHPANVYEKETLKGLTGVFVLVEGLDKEIKRELPFDENQIRVDVELKLRMAGIKVFSEEELSKTPGSPFLYVNLTIRRIPKVRMFHYGIDIHLDQRVFLERNPNIRSIGTTWNANSTGAVWEDRTSEIREYIKNKLNEFINDFLSVNPKGGK